MNANYVSSKPPVKLSNGRTVLHTLASDGSTLAYMSDGMPMSEAEWQEYVSIRKPTAFEQLSKNPTKEKRQPQE